MTNIIHLNTRRNIPVGISGGVIPAPTVDLEAAKAVACAVSLRPGPAETSTQFVTRIVRAYKAEGGK